MAPSVWQQWVLLWTPNQIPSAPGSTLELQDVPSCPSHPFYACPDYLVPRYDPYPSLVHAPSLCLSLVPSPSPCPCLSHSCLFPSSPVLRGGLVHVLSPCPLDRSLDQMVCPSRFVPILYFPCVEAQLSDPFSRLPRQTLTVQRFRGYPGSDSVCLVAEKLTFGEAGVRSDRMTCLRRVFRVDESPCSSWQSPGARGQKVSG